MSIDSGGAKPKTKGCPACGHYLALPTEYLDAVKAMRLEVEKFTPAIQADAQIDLRASLTRVTEGKAFWKERCEDFENRARSEYRKKEAAQKANRETVKKARQERERRKAAERKNAELVKAATWVLHNAHGVSKGEGYPTTEAQIASLKGLQAALDSSPRQAAITEDCTTEPDKTS